MVCNRLTEYRHQEKATASAFAKANISAMPAIGRWRFMFFAIFRWCLSECWTDLFAVRYCRSNRMLVKFVGKSQFLWKIDLFNRLTCNGCPEPLERSRSRIDPVRPLTTMNNVSEKMWRFPLCLFRCGRRRGRAIPRHRQVPHRYLR